MTKFLTMKEAGQLIGKSPSSVRRILYPILKDGRHPDRRHIEPDVATVKALRMKGESFPWKISEELLRREIPEDGPRSTQEMKSTHRTGADASGPLIEILRKQLDIKDQQIATQNELILGMSERLREGNILMGTLQRQLSPPESAGRDQTGVVEADAPSPQSEKGSGKADASAKRTPWYLRKIF